MSVNEENNNDVSKPSQMPSSDMAAQLEAMQKMLQQQQEQMRQQQEALVQNLIAKFSHKTSLHFHV